MRSSDVFQRITDVGFVAAGVVGIASLLALGAAVWMGWLQ
jgi:hypothetical protein